MIERYVKEREELRMRIAKIFSLILLGLMFGVLFYIIRQQTSTGPPEPPGKEEPIESVLRPYC